MKKNLVKIINFKSSDFGIFKAIELDFSQFKNGIIAIKGKSGEGKSTVQNAVKTTTQGRETLADSEMYGDEWENEIQLIDGERKIFIQAVKKKDATPVYYLFERDSDGKKVQSPIIDGVKATPAKYFESLTTELTFGIREFLSENDTVHKKFMMKLFEPELNILGVDELKIELEKLTSERDYLRNQCQHEGAYVADFERDGYKVDQLAEMQVIDIKVLEQQKNELLIKKGKVSGDTKADFEKRKSEITQKGNLIVDEFRTISDRLNKEYNSKIESNKKDVEFNTSIEIEYGKFFEATNSLSFLNENLNFKKRLLDRVNQLSRISHKVILPVNPIFCPEIIDGKIHIDSAVKYDCAFDEVIEKRKQVGMLYNKLLSEIKESENTELIELQKIDSEISVIESKITNANFNNKLIERYDLNRRWVEASAKVEIQRNEIAKKYAQINTGVEGLYMKPFYNESGKFELKTVYTGCYDFEYFKPQSKLLKDEKLQDELNREQLLVSYSSTQKPIIGVLLQVARLKMKGKYLPYIFLDDIPLDKKATEIIAKIAEENGLTILTSMTGDFDKDKLVSNEILIEGGEIFFNN